MKKNNKLRLHFIGIGGIGMSGISEVFFQQGYEITGSDLQKSDTTEHLVALGIKIYHTHSSENVFGADVVVVSSAIRSDNVEWKEAQKQRIPIVSRAEMLGELMRGKVGIAVAGSHGKTTTTSMLASILTVAGWDPTCVIGGKVNALGGNAKLGKSDYVLVEADESDGSFLRLPAQFAVLTNIDNDHLDHFKSMDAMRSAFIQFIGQLPFYGKAILCGEDLGIQSCMSAWTKPFQIYGFSEDFDLFAKALNIQPRFSEFQVFFNSPSGPICLGTCRLNVPGKHNVLNALGSIAMGLVLNIPFMSIVKGLEQFSGVKRRFEILYENTAEQQAIVQDYGHHPTEIQHTLTTARQFWSGRIITVFQPHRYTRTLHCYKEFLSAFFDSDWLMITDIYSAGEDPIESMHSSRLARDIEEYKKPEQKILYTGSLDSTAEQLVEVFSSGDLLLFLGAGSIEQLAKKICALQRK